MFKCIGWSVTSRAAGALLLAACGFVGPLAAEPGNDNRTPDLGEHQDLAVPAGHKVAFHTYAEGVQIYRWDGQAWIFQRPEAVLFASGKDDGIVGIHYGGPTWESASGSFVVAAVSKRATADSTAIPWLLLEAVASQGPGTFRDVTYIQRVNTVSGLAPADAGDFVGEEARVPYAADYYFYRQSW